MHKMFIGPLVLALAGCTGGEAPPAASPPLADSTSAIHAIDLSGQDIPLVVELGQGGSSAAEAPVAVWNEESGHMEVKAGDHFGILISEEPGDMARLKATLERDQLQTHEITQESTDQLVYRSKFPDDALVFMHFCRIIQVDGREFVVQDDPSGKYNEADIERMMRAVRTQRPV